MATRLSDAYPGDPMTQNELAWTLLTELKNPDADLAEKLAIRANERTDGKVPEILDTLARAYFVNGKKGKAIAMQEKAVALADQASSEQFQTTLDSYRKGQLPR